VLNDLGLVLVPIIFLVPIVGVGMLFCARSVQNRATQPIRFRFLLRLTATVCALLVLLAIIGVGIVGSDPIAVTLINLSDVMAFVIGLAVVAIVVWVGILALKLEFDLRAESKGEPNAAKSISQRLHSIRMLGWIFTGLPLLLFVPLTIVFTVLPVFPLAIGFLLMSAHKRKRQGHLLWLLAIAVRHGIPLADEIEEHSKTIWWPRSRRRTHGLAELLREGIPLAEALNQMPGLVPRHAVIGVSVGAETGRLAESLRESATRHTETMQLAASAASVLWFGLYLFVVISVMQSMLAFMTTFLVPKFKKIFAGFDVELPPGTQLVIKGADDVANEFILYIPIIASPLLFMFFLGLIYYCGWGDLNIPWIGGLFRRHDSPWLLRNLANTVSSSVSIPDAMDTMSEFCLRTDSRRRLKRMETAIRAGEECWEVLKREGLINAKEYVVLKSAQQANNLPWALNEMADSIERRLQYRLLYLFELFKPVIVIAIGLAVLLVCVAFFMPLVQLIGTQP